MTGPLVLGARRLAAGFAALVLAGGASDEIPDFDNRATLSNPDKILAFVGEKIAIIEFDPAEDDPEEEDPDNEIIHLDAGYKARYRVRELVHGAFEKETVDFKAFDHFGFPDFAEHDVAMLYLVEAEGALYHMKYTYDAVYPTADGRYAFCGDPYLGYREDEIDRRPLHPISFDPPIVVRISGYLIPESQRKDYSEQEIAEAEAEVKAFFKEPDFEIDGDTATCKMGVYPNELFRIRNETRFLPERREGICVEKLNHPGISDESQEKNRRCAEEMKARGEPQGG